MTGPGNAFPADGGAETPPAGGWGVPSGDPAATALLLVEQGRCEAAAERCFEALRAGNVNAPLFHSLGAALHGLGYLEEAAQAFREALRRNPASSPSYLGYTGVLLDGGAFGAALRVARVLSALEPAESGAILAHARALAAMGVVPPALALLRRARHASPADAAVWHVLAAILNGLKSLTQADAAERRALALRPEALDFWYSHALALRESERWTEAAAALEHCLRLAPGHAPARDLLGFVLGRLGNAQRAGQLHRQALALDPALADAFSNLAKFRNDGEAETLLSRAVASAPGAPGPRYDLSLLQLGRGALTEGWAGYAGRFAALGYVDRPSPLPHWNGQSPDGRSFLVWREQGLGDEVLFSSCLGDLARRAARVVFECSPRLHSLFARSFPDVEVVEAGNEAGLDFHAPLGDLARFLRPDLGAFSGGPWLVADPGWRRVWRERLTALGPGLRVGICWRSQSRSLMRQGLYTELKDWGPILALSGVHLINLQYDDCEAEIVEAEAASGVHIHRWGDLDQKNDIDGVAALIAELDLVVTAPTFVSELSGALGVPVFRLSVPDWTALGTLVRPWFGTMRSVPPAPGQPMASAVAEAARLIERARRTSVGRAPQPIEPVADPSLDPAIALYRQGRLAEAALACRRAVAVKPEFARGLHLLGILRRRQGDAAGGVVTLFRAIRADPLNADAVAAIATGLNALGQDRGAFNACGHSLVLDPGQAAVWALRASLQMGDELISLRHAAEARERRARWASHAARVQPLSAEFQSGLGKALGACDRFDEAGAAYRRALVLDPGLAPVWSGSGTVLGRTGGDRRSVLRVFERAVRIDPNLAEAHANLGTYLQECGEAEAARAAFERAIAADGQFAMAHLDLAQVLLAQGETRRGWSEYEWRFETDQMRVYRRHLRMPPWRGQNLTGRRLLIWREQGVGDEILFSSCYAEAIARAGHAVIETDRRLVGLFQRSFPQATVRAETPNPADADVHIAAGSLPRLLRHGLDRFPARDRWLVPDPARLSAWGQRLAALPPGLRVGVSWRSGHVTADRKAAYVTLDDWAPVFAVPGLVFVNLQYGDAEAELLEAETRFGVTIHRWPDLDLKDDFEGTAALIAGLDLVIAPATAAGELAGALGVPTWRFCWSDWTRLGSGTRPWFPAMRVFTPGPGQILPTALPRIAAKLRAMTATAVPADPMPLLEQAVARHQSGDIEDARDGYERVLRIDPNQPVALHLSGLAAHEMGNDGEAVRRIAASLRVLPDYAAAWCSLALVRMGQGEDEAAAGLLRRSLALQPADPGVLTTFGNALGACAEWVDAERAHARAAALAPDAPHIHDNRGVALLRLDRDAEALAEHRTALRLAPERAEAWSNLALAERKAGRFDVAEAACRVALALAPGFAEAAGNIGRALYDLDRQDGAGRWNRRAIALDPAAPGPRFNQSLIDLQNGALIEGWAGYDERFRSPEIRWAAPRLTIPAWQGEDLRGKRILVWREQGVGDEILFSSMIPDLARRAGQVVFACDPRLVSLYRRSFPGVEVVGGSGEGIDANVHAAVGSLPRHLRGSLSDFPAQGGWLIADAERAAVFEARLGPGLRIGIGWRSGVMTGDRRGQYLTAGDLAPILTLPGTVAVNLQYGSREEEIVPVERELGVSILRWPDLDLKNDFEGVAALMSRLDLVITTATSVGELAGALGVPVWRLGVRQDWTGLGSGVRPWYPAMRLFTPKAGRALSDLPAVAARALSALR